MKHVGLVILASLALLFVSCGSKIQGKYVFSLLGMERGYVFKGNKVTGYTSFGGEVQGTYTFDSQSNTIHIEWNDGEEESDTLSVADLSDNLTYSPSTGNISDGELVYQKQK